MQVKDAHGGMKKYGSEKIIKSCMRAGFSREAAEEIESRVFEKAWDSITTRRLQSIVYTEMKKHNEAYALRYRLRESIADLNPNYHEFEKYITKLLREDGVEAEWSPRPMPHGECIKHEIDVVARRHDKTILVECKHHYHHHRYTGLDVPMRQWARLQDINKGHKLGVKHSIDADRGWVVVNTKLSDQAKTYARCKDIAMTAWQYPEGDSLNAMVERTKAYPVTIIRPPHHVRVELSKNDILTVKELVDLSDEQQEEVGIKAKVLEDLQRTADRILTS